MGRKKDARQEESRSSQHLGSAGSNGWTARAAPQPARGRHDAEADAGPMGGRHRQGRGPEELGRAALRQLAESCGRGGGEDQSPAADAGPPCLTSSAGHFPHAAGSSLSRGGEAWGARPGTARGRSFQSPALPPETPVRGCLGGRDGGGGPG